jgi:hypothetical protein
MSSGPQNGKFDAGHDPAAVLVSDKYSQVEAFLRRTYMKGNDIDKKKSPPMTNTLNQTKRLSQSWRKHVRRMKQAARKTGIAYIASRPVISQPAAIKPAAVAARAASKK